LKKQGDNHALPGTPHLSYFHPPNLTPALCAVNKMANMMLTSNIRSVALYPN